MFSVAPPLAKKKMFQSSALSEEGAFTTQSMEYDSSFDKKALFSRKREKISCQVTSPNQEGGLTGGKR